MELLFIYVLFLLGFFLPLCFFYQAAKNSGVFDFLWAVCQGKCMILSRRVSLRISWRHCREKEKPVEKEDIAF